jgi:transcriptional regulator with XRE-family HTH domain
MPRKPRPLALAQHLGNEARKARHALDLTQEQVAEKVNLAPEVYGRMERGRAMPSVPTLRRICSVLRADANVLVGLTRTVQLADSLPQAPPLPDSPDMLRLIRIARTLDSRRLNLLARTARALGDAVKAGQARPASAAK